MNSSSRMEMTYLELLTRIMDSLKPQLHQEFIAQVNKFFLRATSDSKLLGFRPGVIAMSALRCSLNKLQTSTAISDDCLTRLTSLLDHDRKAELVKCHKIMEEQSVDGLDNLICHGIFLFCPSSPTTVLLKERINLYDNHVDFSLFNMRGRNMINVEPRRTINKRKREEDVQ